MLLFTKNGARFARLSILFFTFWLANNNVVSAQGCGCTNCPQFMPDNFVGSFFINVQNADNPTLGQNGQGVCGVTMNINHEYIGDLSITLTSPSGQSVTLVGPIGLFGETDGTSWNVAFVPCGEAADPDPGFSNTWNNNQTWGLGGSYGGSYYPSSGCLENFNSGPVNGTWTLTVVDGQASDVGNFLDYDIIFCDPSGIDCFSCAANAGELPQPDVAACEGSMTLDLELPPTYVAPNVAPPPATYSYTYVISGPGGIILDFDPNADLSSYPTGTYSVCGMSYLTAQQDLLPSPNGSLTVNQLRTQLNSGTAPFCGKITNNCVNVTINPAPEDQELFVELCAPQCYLFNGISRCVSGTYTANLLQNGCPYTATLYLTVGQPKFTNITEFICNGGCSANPLFPNACATGSYQEVLQTSLGCDSTINLNVSVISANANISNQPVIPCGGGTVQLSGVGSSTGGYTYLWTASNGGNIVGSPTGINANVNAAGDYQLRVCRTQGGVTCCDSAQVTIESATTTPPAPAGISGSTTLCQGQTLDYFITPVNGASSYTWTVPAGVTINTGATGVLTNVTWTSATGGPVCVTANNGCGPSAPTCLNITVGSAPTASVPQGNATVCAANTTTYTIPAVANAAGYTWTVTAPAQIVSGQGTNTIQVAWNGATSADVCVTTNNSCGTSPQQCLPVTIGAIPGVPVITGANTACTQATETYSITPIAGASSYIWTVTGGVIASGQGTASVQVTWNNNATSGTVCVRSSNNCGDSNDQCFNVTLSAPPAQPAISGENTLCPGDTAVYTSTTVGGALGYTWTAPAGATIIAGQGSTSATIVFGTAPGGNVSVAVNGNCGTAPQVTFPVTVNPFPVANAGIDIVQCGNGTALNAAGSGVWSQLSGPAATVFANNNAANSGVTVPQTGVYNYIWLVNVAGCVSADTVTVNYESIPAAGALSIVCDQANENYTVSFPIIGGLAPFTVAGGTVTNGVFTSTPIVSGTPYQFTIVDANNCVSVLIQGAHNCNCSTSAGTMSLMPLQACGTATVTAVQQTLPVLDANDTGVFVLHTGSGNTIINPIAQNTTGVFAFQSGMTYGQTYYISFVAGNNVAGSPSASDPCYSVAQGQPVTFYAIPVADAGTILENCGNSITLNATGSGTWTVVSSPTNGSLQFTNNNDPVSEVSTSVFGTYTLQWTVSANGCSSTDQTEITFNPNPVVSNIDRICDPTNQFFSVIFDLSGGTAPYIIDGVTITGTAYVSSQFASGQSYNLTVSDSRGCTTTAVVGSYACNCATDAGTMSNAPLKACATQTVQAAGNNDATLDGNDVVAYILHDAPGTIAGTILDQNTTGVFGFVPGMILGQTYYISRIAGNPLAGSVDPNDPCFSVSAGQEVVFLEIPAPDAGPDVAVCGNDAALAGVAGGFPGQWSFVSGPGTASIASPPALNTNVGVTQPGTYVFRWTATNDICTGSDDATVVFRPLPQAAVASEDCNNTNTQYQITVNVSGGTAPYTVNGIAGTFAGSVFTSGFVTNNTAYSFTVTDAFGCTVGPVTGLENCNCATDAGSMSTAPLTFCADQPAVGVWDNNAQLDGNDTLRFVLHSAAGLTLGQIFATSNTPEFDFTNNLTLGQTYYISAIAGDNLNGTVDPSDPCFSVTAGTPVQWKALPTATLAGTTTICVGGAAQLVLNGTGQYPLTVSWTDNSGQTQSAAITSAQGAQVNVAPDSTTVYTLTSVTDGGLPVCANQAAGSATITVNQPLEAGTALTALEFCVGSPDVVALSDLLTGESAGGVWTETSSAPSAGGAFNAGAGTFAVVNQVPGLYQFLYKVTPLAPCPAAEAAVSVQVRPEPTANAGPDKVIDCDTPTAILGNSGAGLGLTYVWSLNGTPLTNAGQNLLEANAGGVYTLLVTNVFGCTSSDETTVTTQLEAPVFEQVAKTNVSCFGERDGFIEIKNVTGGTPPYLYSFNGGAFSSATKFGPLSGGSYSIEVSDANGCTTVSDVIDIVEPAQLIAQLGPDILVKLGDSASVTLQLGANADWGRIDTIIWNPLLDTAGVGLPQQIFFPTRHSAIQVFVRDTSGCSAEDRLEFRVDRRRNIYVPNIFYPAGSENNIAIIFGGNDVAEIKYFQIFDRWGAMVHETTNFQPGDLSKGWNGTIGNQPAQPAVFVWVAAVLFKDGLTELFSGDVTVTK